MLTNILLARLQYSASSINRPDSTGRYIQLFSLKSTRVTVEKKLESQQTMLSRSSFLIL